MAVIHCWQRDMARTQMCPAATGTSLVVLVLVSTGLQLYLHNEQSCTQLSNSSFCCSMPSPVQDSSCSLLGSSADEEACMIKAEHDPQLVWSSRRVKSSPESVGSC